jgi:uncharacterized cupin superfamily protein
MIAAELIPTSDRSRQAQANPHGLDPAPIPSGWILEAVPEARGRILSCSSDAMAFTVMWDCTAGRFNWFYDIDETICVMEGTVTLRDTSGAVSTLIPGDTFFFPAGCSYEWTVPHYVRKIAFIHVPMSRKMRLVRRAFKLLTGLFRPGSRAGAGTGGLLKAD